jgi:tRNA dimethylallyltransferase
MSPKDTPQIIVIVGPTASGKSTLAVDTAKLFSGEVISADSRQVYRGLDVASGTITDEEMRGIPHHLLNVADPHEQFTVVDFKQKAEAAINDILARDHLPIVAGGSGFYIQSVVDNFTPPPVEPNQALRNELQQKDTKELHSILQEMDQRRAAEIDENNPRRLIRAIEIADELGHVPKKEDNPPKFDCLQIGLKLSKETLRERIHERTILRLKEGMIKEARQLHEGGLSYERMKQLGLEYELLAKYLEGNIETKEELQKAIETADWQYARKQMSWFRRDDRIQWHHPTQKDAIYKKVDSFLRTQ